MYRTASTGWCAHLHDRVLNKPMNYQQRTPYPCVRVVYIAGDTLRHQPMGASHMTMLQLRGPIGSCVLPWWLFIAGDTLCHQPMGTGHMTVLQSCGLMEFRVLQWCHPMLASTRWDKLLYPDHYLVWYAKVDSGPHNRDSIGHEGHLRYIYV